MTGYRWRIILVLFVMAVALYVDRVNISVAAPALAQEFNLSPAALGTVLSVFLFGYAIGLIPGGYLADRVGPRRLLTIAGLLWGISTAAVACLPYASKAALMALVGARFLLGLCEACAFPTFNRAVANWMLPGERARASGWLHCGAGLGGALTPPLIAVVTAYWGWRAAFLLSGVLTCSVALWWFRAATDHPADHPRVSAAELNLIVSHREDDKIKPWPPDVAWFRRMLRSREAWLLAASEFSFGVAGFVFATWFYTYLVRVRGAQSMQSAWLSSMPYMAIALGAPLGGFLCDRSARLLGAPWGRRLIPLVTIPLSGIALAFAPFRARGSAFPAPHRQNRVGAGAPIRQRRRLRVRTALARDQFLTPDRPARGWLAMNKSLGLAAMTRGLSTVANLDSTDHAVYCSARRAPAWSGSFSKAARNSLMASSRSPASSNARPSW